MLGERLQRYGTGELSHASFARHVRADLRNTLRLCPIRFQTAPPAREGSNTLGNVALLCCDLEPQQQRFLLTGAGNGAVTLWDTSHADYPAAKPPTSGGRQSSAGAAASVLHPLLRLPRAHRFACTAVSWYPDGGGLFFSASVDGTVRGFDAHSQPIAGGRDAAIHFTVASGAKVTCLSLPRQSSALHGLVAAGTHDGKVVLFDPGAGGGTHTLVGHRDTALALAWIPGSEWLLATAGADSTLRLWDVRRSGTLHMFDVQHTTADAGSYGGADCDKHDADDGDGMARQLATAHDGSIVALAPSPDGRLLFTSATDGRLRAWCVRTGLHVGTHFACDDVRIASGTQAGRPSNWGANASRMASGLAVTSDGECIYRPVLDGHAVGLSFPGAVQCFSTATGECTRRLTGGHAAIVRDLAVRGESGEVFTVSQDGRMLAWTTGRAYVPDDNSRVVIRANTDAWSDDEQEHHRGPRMQYNAS